MRDFSVELLGRSPFVKPPQGDFVPGIPGVQLDPESRTFSALELDHYRVRPKIGARPKAVWKTEDRTLQASAANITTEKRIQQFTTREISETDVRNMKKTMKSDSGLEPQFIANDGSAWSIRTIVWKQGNEKIEIGPVGKPSAFITDMTTFVAWVNANVQKWKTKLSETSPRTSAQKNPLKFSTKVPSKTPNASPKATALVQKYAREIFASLKKDALVQLKNGYKQVQDTLRDRIGRNSKSKNQNFWETIQDTRIRTVAQAKSKKQRQIGRDIRKTVEGLRKLISEGIVRSKNPDDLQKFVRTNTNSILLAMKEKYEDVNEAKFLVGYTVRTLLLLNYEITRSPREQIKKQLRSKIVGPYHHIRNRAR